MVKCAKGDLNTVNILCQLACLTISIPEIKLKGLNFKLKHKYMHFYDFWKKITIFRQIVILGPPKVEAQFWKWEKIVMIFEFSATNSIEIGCPLFKYRKKLHLVPPLLEALPFETNSLVEARHR